MEAWLVHLGYVGVFIGVGMESAGIPLPGETILLTASALAAHGRLSVAAVAAVAFGAAVLGDNAGFLVGRKGGRPLLELWTVRVHAEDVLLRLDHFFERFGAAAVFFARFVPGVRVLAALFAGASRRMPWQRFLAFNALGAAVWVLWAVAIGYYGFVALERAAGTERALTIVLAAGVAAAAGAVVYQVVRAFRGKKRHACGA